jgi:hypothetical protein
MRFWREKESKWDNGKRGKRKEGDSVSRLSLDLAMCSLVEMRRGPLEGPRTGKGIPSVPLAWARGPRGSWLLALSHMSLTYVTHASYSYCSRLHPPMLQRILPYGHVLTSRVFLHHLATIVKTATLFPSPHGVPHTHLVILSTALPPMHITDNCAQLIDNTLIMLLHSHLVSQGKKIQQ